MGFLSNLKKKLFNTEENIEEKVEDLPLQEEIIEVKSVIVEEPVVETEIKIEELIAPTIEVVIPKPQPKEEPTPEPESKGFFSKLTESLKLDKIKTGLSKTRRSFLGAFSSLFAGDRKIDDALLAELEELLITSDIGYDTTTYIIKRLKEIVRDNGYETADDCYRSIKEIIKEIMIKSPSADTDKIFAVKDENKPYVIMVIGVNGVGKTTTIGKLAYNYRMQGLGVVIGAADTFRAAANEQLEIWSERAGVQIVQQKQGADPAAVAFDTIKSAIAKNKDVVLIDTAGRLHNKTNLMAELDKINRVMNKLKPTAPDEVFLVLDATTGQNAIQQAKEFSKVANVTGIILTKLDGTAKGGVVIPISHELKIPVRFIGVGEQIDDLMPFDPNYFIDGMFNITDEDISAIEG